MAERSAAAGGQPANSPILEAPPSQVRPDVAAVWAEMCPSVRERYAAATGSGRVRQVALRAILWLARRRLKGNPTPVLPPVLPIRESARVLVIQPDHLGGVLLSSPAFMLLKRARPISDLTVLAGPWGQDSAAHCPAVNRVRVFPFHAFDRSGRWRGLTGRVARAVDVYVSLLRLSRELRIERYDAAVNVIPEFWWGAALAALAGIPIRAGFGSADAAPFLTHSLPPPTATVGHRGSGGDSGVGGHPPDGRTRDDALATHAAELSLAVVRLLLAEDDSRLTPGALPEPLAEVAAINHTWPRMAYEPAAADRADAVRIWRAAGLEGKEVVAMQPSPGGPPKAWVAQRFAQVADHLAGRGFTVILTGAPSDVAETRAVAAACRRQPVVLAGQTSFGALASILERCRFAIGPDNGAMHLACASGVPTIRLYGPTDPRTWSSWPPASTDGDPAVAPSIEIASERRCSPCHRLDLPPWQAVSGDGVPAYPCMVDIPVERVIAAVEEMRQRLAAASAPR